MNKIKYIAFTYLFTCLSTFAAGSYTLNGTYGCVSSPNFSGFVNRVTNGTGSSKEGNALLILKFNTGSSTVSFSGVSNTINDFEKNTANVKTSTFSNVTHFTYTPNSPIENMYMLQDTSTNPPFISYFILVNSGKTLIGIDAPTVDKNSNFICQAL